MAKETHRPTKSNYQDYLFDFSNVDFSQYAGPEDGQKAEEAPGFLSRLGNTALAIGEGLTMLPGGVVDTVRDAWRGGEIDVTDTEALREREARAREQAAYAQKYAGKAFDGVTDAMISMPYSLATMGASLGAGIPAGMVAGPVAGGAAGMAASGTMAYRASRQDFMENMLAETTRLLGRTPTQEEWDRVAREFDSEASQYGLWEAGPEALSNLFMARLLGPLGKRVFADGVGKAARRVAGLYGEELATETATQMGQGAIEADLGLRDEAPGFLQALGEVAPATFWQTTLMAGGKKGLDMLARRYGREQVAQEKDGATEVQADEQAASATREPMALPEGARLALPEAPIVMGTTDAGLGPIPSPSAEEVNARLWREQAARRGVEPLPGDPFTDPAAARETEDFVRRFEEAERLAGEEALLPDRSSPQGGMQLALESGQAVDLLAPPRQTGFLNALGQSALPVERENAGYVTVPAAPDMRAVSAAAPVASRMALPPANVVPTGAGNGTLPHVGLQETTALPAVSGAPAPLPTQAPLAHIQTTPRADVPAPAGAPAMPAPAAIVQEAQPAPQTGDMAAPAAMPVQLPVTPPVVPAPEAATMETPRQDVSPSMEERAASAQAAHEETAPLMYRGAPISRMPIGDDRRESQADSILQAAGQKAKNADDAQMQAAVADIQRERKHVGVTHDALWDRIHEEIFPYVQEGGSAQKASSRAELLEQLPREKRAEARRKTTPELREMVRAQTADPFGPAYTEFSGRPAEAIDYLLQTKGGHVPAAFHKEGLGDIDLPWGKAGKGGYGLAHIIERRNTQRKDGEDFVRRLPAIIAKGKTETREGFPGRVYVVSHEGSAEAVISLSYLGADRIWLLTGYEYRKTPSRQQSDDRPVTAFGNEQHIPSLHPDGEKNSRAGRGSRQAQTSTIGNAPADERFLSSSNSGAPEKMVTIPTVEVNEAAAPSGPADDAASGKAAVTLEGKQNTSTPPVAEQRKTILQSLPEALRKANRGAPLKKLKELAKQQESDGGQTDVGAQPEADNASYGTASAPDTVALAKHFAAAFLRDKKFGTIVEARREAASLLGGAVRPATEAAKAVDEAIELGVTLAARRIVADMRKRQASDADIYRALVSLYQRQPRLSVRTSTSVAQQAYSTPAPLAFVASRLAGIDEKSLVFEPTAGNGMLLMEADPKHTTANELNAARAARLRSQGFTVSERDAVDYAPSGMDVVIANPPFGRVKDADRRTKEFSVNGLTTKELDHAIVARALGALKQGGRAVLIIGGKQGNDASRSRKYRAADQVSFWNWLFGKYHVLDHFSVDGKLYERQGAGYPIDIIVLENSGTSRGRVFPGAALPRVYTSFGDLEEVLHGQVVDAAERTTGTDGPDTGRVGDGTDSQSGRADRAADAETAGVDRGRVRSRRDTGTDGARSGERLDPRVRDDRSAETGGGRILGSERPADESGNDVSSDAEGGRAGGTRQADLAADGHRGGTGERSGRDDAGRVGELGDSGDVRPELGVSSPARQQAGHKSKAVQKPKSTEFQVAYEPASTLPGMGTLVPRNMATAARQAMAELERRHGGIDQYVADQLGYPVKDLGKYFAAEQVDALGMAISNIADGSGFIIGDQTGIGKGRVNAGIIRWAKRQGYIPVFVTMKPDLYADMVRDLADIGMEGFTPLPTNAGLSGDDVILLPDGRTLKTKTAKAHEKVLREVMQNGMGAYDAVFTTYDQLNPVKGKDTFRRQFMMEIAPNAVFILDESHNAGGQASTRKKADAADDRAQFVRRMLQASRQGTFYSSATYAKRPDVMSLYFKTDMQYAADDMGKLAEAIERGGIPMQQVVAAELTETGQYLRRERSFEGAEVQTSTVSINKDRAEKTADIMRAIMAFDDAKEAAVEAADKEAAKTGGSVGDNKSTGKGGASSTNFTAVMHNVIAQSLLAQKVEAVVDAAEADIARGEKVVIALSNTMGSMIKEFAEQNGIAVGSPINFTFNDMFVRYLEKSRMIAIREPGQKVAKERRRLTDEELGPDGVRAYNEALAVIRNSDFGGLPVSVIDRMLAEFDARGIKADEITGRTERIDYTTAVPTYAKRTTGPSDRIRVVDAFNSGKLDVVILNQAGSTGISLHSSERFRDQRRRNMIIAQAESNIDVFMQTLGRVFRTGQVVPPTYQLIMSDLPAEKRPAAILAKKMSSLNANTTASRESDTSFRNIPDFLNKYGDRVARQVMADNPALSVKLGSPVGESTEDAMRKVTGRIPLLPVREQEQLYTLLETEYNDLIAQLEAMGGTGLEAKSLPLDARLLDEVEIVPAKEVGKDTPFAGAARIGTYDVKRLGKPWPSAKVKEMVQAADVPDMEKLFQEAQVWHDGKARDMSDEAAANQQNRLNFARDVIADAARMRPGTPVLISGENLLMEGVMLRLYHKGSAENPLALSTWKMDIALPDASRKITIPLSQTVRQEDSITVTPSYRDPAVLYGMFDSAQKESREKAHIITGNILAAFQQIDGKGNVITFQDHEGHTIPGIMLPKDTDPQKLLDGMDVSLSPDAAIRFLRELPGKAAVKTADKLLVLSHDGSDFTVSVPSSKAKGAQYFLNRDVLEAAGQDFIRSGQSMVLRHLSEGQAAGIMQALSDQGYGFVADNNRDEARKIMADTDSQALASLASRPARRPDTLPARFADMPMIEADSTQWFGPGKAIDTTPITETSEQTKALREAVKAWARERFPNGTTATNADTGWDVQITPKGVQDSLSHGFNALLARSVPFIPQIIEGGIHVDSIRKTPQLLSHIFAGKIRLDGQDYVVGFVLREDVNGNRFYDHELTKIISPDWLVPGHPSSEGPSSEGSSGHRTNRGDVMNILRERLGVNDKTGQVLFQIAGQFLPPKFKGRRAPSVEAVRRLADKMNGMAANAARIQVVENADALPKNLRDAYASQAARVEGLYDPAKDTVWLVAENLESLERAAEVWLHENMVHHGLRSALAPAQRRLLLNQLWLGMGGMKNERIRSIAQKYGRDPRGNEAERLLIMEEALANLAERRARGLLRTAQERSFWRRFVDALVRAWNGMVYALTGRMGRMGRSQMERLLDALQGHVMEGMPAAATGAALREELEGVGSLASLRTDRQEAARAAWEQLQKDMEAWGRQVDEFNPKASGADGQRSLLMVCQTPDVLRKLGAPDLPMSMTASNLAKILSDKQDHQLPKELVKQLPAALAAPVMVFESATTAESFVVLTELKHGGRSVMAAVHLDTERQNIRVNDIASAYRRGNEAWYLRQMEEGRLLYQDKKKSLAWARTNRLQLPKVRKLPARLSENRILTEEDVVKPADPGRGGENTPLASLASRPSGLTESVASGIRALRKVMGRGVSADVEDILSNREMGNLIPRHDLSLAERLFKLPHWVAKDHAGFARVYDRQLRRVEERSAALKASLEQVPLLFAGDASKRLSQKEQEQLAAMIWKWDGKQIGPIHAIEKFLVTGQTMNGRDVLELNPDYQKKFRAWLKGQPEPERVKQAFLQVREALDTAFLRAYNKMAAMADLADTDLEMYRTEFGSIHNYFPHQRTGKYFVTARVGRETVFRKHFDVPLGSSVREEWAKIVAEHRKDFPDATWDDPREVQKLPDDILGAPIDPQAMEQIISAAAARLGDGEQAERVRSTLLSGIADILKARGFGAHGIRRQNIPGFETQDVKGVLYSYMAGLNGWLTKMEAAADFAQALGKIDASASPRLWEYASQYTKDMLRNSDQIDRITGNIKSVAFAWYLGGNIKTAVVNLTQNAVVGVPRLQQYVTGGGARWLKSAMDTIGLSYSGKGMEGARKLTTEEAAMLQELYGNSVITDAYMEEVRGQVSASPTLRMWERFTRLLGWPMSKVEIFNRASLALAAYRAAKAGAFKAHALKTFGLHEGQKMTHEQARDFAAMLVRDTHFEYGRGNQPEFLRSNVAGRMLSPIFTFRSFGANILNLWWRALRYEGKEGRAFVAKSLGATVALGGLTAFPFYATLAALCAAASGDDEDWTSKIRNALPANNLLRDVVCYGLPALAGVNIGGSLRMETPFTEGMKRGETFKEAMTESLGDLLGIPYDLAVNKPSKFLEARRFDADYRAVEALVPTFVANIMQAWRLSTEGQTTMRGRPINSPGQPGARKLSTGEALGKALGFQPTSSAKSYEAYAADKRRTQIRSDRIDDFVNEALRDLESKGRPYMMRELRKALLAWNATMEAEGKPAMRIMPKDVLRRVAARRRENRPSREQREKGAAQMATWGV
ncbi:PLxRFG domain-containing protein [uncultured Desulfovibrio sp.]|uniref:PLxRFG domain-containing protein n=1 Tax=uncultured Desulfovibrio sp. TaxID=167968 RepID=UPI002623AC61|nr:PLxRFG domain-containing protein [uncultured Desulfovibrio sp.]